MSPTHMLQTNNKTTTEMLNDNSFRVFLLTYLNEFLNSLFAILVHFLKHNIGNDIPLVP